MFEWEESLFVGIKAVYQRIFTRPKEQQQAAVRVTLKEQRGNLLYLGRMLSGRDVTLFETDDLTLCGRDRIFLPKEFTLGQSPEANRSLYELRTIIAALAIRNQWTGGKRREEVLTKNGKSDGASLRRPPTPDGHSIQPDLRTLLAPCFDEFPGLPEKIGSVENALGLNGEFWSLLGHLPEGGSKSLEGEQDGFEVPAPDGADSETVTEIEGRGQTDVDVLPESALNGPENNMPEHVFEKTETIEEHGGLFRKSDDEESLEENEEALREVNMKHLVRTPERPRSIYRADVMLDGLCFETDEEAPTTGIPYPEWDYRKAAYKPDWCFLNETIQSEVDLAWPTRVETKHRRLIHRLKAQFATMTSEWLRMKRQPSGNEFDIDAVVNSQVELLSGHTPSENLYQDRKRDLHDVSAMILLDQSYSTDAWLNDVRVLDVIAESIHCVGEVLEDYIETFAIAGFASNTRRACRFNVLKEFSEPWSEAKNRLGAVQPEGYTRIGPALRHAQEKLINEKASRKIVILLTDGRPCDYDRYEGKHGIQDVKKAIETGLQYGVHTHAFAIEKQAAEYFPQMFTGHHFDILPNPDKLSGALTKLFAKLITG